VAINNLESLEKICGKVFGSLPLLYQWQWDEDLHAARITFGEEHAQPVLTTLSTQFHHEWDFSTIEQASPAIAGHFNAAFGLFPGQKAFTHDSGGITLFAVWWPWGDGDKISLRVGVFYSESSDVDKAEIQKHLIRWFAI
jgi:hypothetical protein